jgi:putative transposase
MYRHGLTQTQWERIEQLLPGKAEDRGVTAKDNRLFVEAVLWILRTGTPWRDLSERYGNWNSIYQRFNRWAKAGVWQRIFQELVLDEVDVECLMIDSTIVRAHQHAAGAKGGRTSNR